MGTGMYKMAKKCYKFAHQTGKAIPATPISTDLFTDITASDMKLDRLIALLILSMMWLSSNAAQPQPLSPVNTFADNYSVSFITMQEGLSHNFVEDIFRDSKGYMWIATSGSLARYDGYEFVNFTPNSISRHIKSSFVRKMAEDKFGRLWVVSDGGVDVINLNDLNPVDLSGNGNFKKISVTPASYITSDGDSNIWFRNNKEVVCIQFDDNGNIRNITTLPHQTTATITLGAIESLPGIDRGVLTGIAGEVCLLTIENDRIISKPLSPALSLDPSNYIADFIKVDSIIWIATDAGLYSYDTSSRRVKVYKGGDGKPGTLSQTFVTSLELTENGELIAGCLNGLNIYDRATDGFYQVSASDIDGRPHGLNNDFINCLIAEGDNVWVGTEGCGINLFSPRKLYSKMLRHNSADPETISPNPVNAIFEDGDGTLWVGTVEGGLNKGVSGYDNGFIHFTHASGSLPHNSVSAITADHTGHLWVGTWGGGLCMLDKSNPAKTLRLLNVVEDGRRLEYIGALAYDPYNNLIWIGANFGLFVYDIAADRLSIPFKGADIIRGSVSAVLTPDGRLWIGGLEGVLAVNLKKGAGSNGYEYVHYPNKLDDPKSTVNEKVTSIAPAHDGTIWVGTNGNGIYRFEGDAESGKFVNYNSSDGLPNDVIHGIAEDPHGNLWIATYHGLSCMVEPGNFINFGLNNGLDTEQFYWNAYRRLANGDILFGSVDGMLAIKGLSASGIDKTYPVHFTSLTVDNDKSHGNPVRASIPENDRSFEIGFSSFDYAGESNGRYLYRMTGYEDEWKELPPGRHSVAYMNLSPGNYSLEVKYVGHGQSVDSAPVSVFEIEIVPNFYKRWWFILIVSVAIIGCILAIYKWRIKDLTRQRNELKKAVDDSVKEISEQKTLIEVHAHELSEQNVELKLRNEQISEQKSQLSEMAKKVQQLTADRISFFTNITHEFRTPITLIIGPIERALKLSTNPKVIEQLNFVERNSRYLLSLINQLMDFRKIESGKMEIVTSKGNIRTLIDEIILPFRAYAEERGIEIRTMYHLATPVFNFNEDAVRKVLTNLLGNAIKFTPDNGKVTVYASIFRNEKCGDGNIFYLCVSDTGCGLKEEETDKVFDHFYQGQSQIKYPLIGAADSGIGLYLCRRLVEVYGGTITARNNHGAGCSFRVLMRVGGAEIENSRVSGDGSLSLPVVSQEENQSDRRLTVLVVEDNSDMRGFMRSVLGDHYNVEEAGNGEEALALLENKDVDFIISDLMMPVMDGLELAGKVKENFAISHIPFIMLTAKTSQESRIEGYRKGVDDYILKPFDEEMLLTRINNILANKRRYQRKFVSDMQVDHLEINEDSRDKKFVNKVMEVLKENYTNSYYEVGEFAEALGVSRSLLNKKLQSLMGQGANQLMRMYRLKVAHELILQNQGTKNMNVSEIAFQVGFNDSKYFTRCFTKQFGVNPSVLLRGTSKN